MTRGEFYENVYTFCTLLGGSTTSGIRSFQHNRDEKGVKHSPHLVGLGADVVYDADVPVLLRREWAQRLGLYIDVKPDHDHLQPIDWRAG